ncbi:hypothetical protein MGP2080_12633, partial [marine gamma proteobacterium HTCC2080]
MQCAPMPLKVQWLLEVVESPGVLLGFEFYESRYE